MPKYSRLRFEYKDDFEWIRVIDAYPEEHRYLQFETSVQGVMSLRDHKVPVLEYINIMVEGARSMINDPKRLVLGGLGAGTLFHAFSAEWPGAQMLSVENNPRVLEIARQFFRLPPDCKVILDDLRECFEKQRMRDADLIAIDCYSAVSVPTHLTTLEFMYLLASKLADRGLLVFNLWSPGCNSICADQLKTIISVFEEVAMINCRQDENLVLFARKKGSWTDWPRTLTYKRREYPLLPISLRDKQSWPDFLWEGRVIDDSNVSGG